MPSIILAARGRITTHFREDIGRGFLHNGVDQGHGDGEEEDLRIVAPADGVVIAHGPLGSYGNRLVIKHSDGWTSLLAHHEWQGVKTGDTVKQGAAIAVMGNTGTLFVHSHQELRDENGVQVDPLMHLGTSSTASSIAAPIVIDNPKESINMAEAYAGTPSKKIIHFQPGVKAEFDSIAEYSEWRSAANFLIEHKASDLLSPPPLLEVPNVEWPVFKALCKHFGVPEK